MDTITLIFITGIFPKICVESLCILQQGILTAAVVVFSSGIYSDYNFRLEKVYISLELFMMC